MVLDIINVIVEYTSHNIYKKDKKWQDLKR